MGGSFQPFWGPGTKKTETVSTWEEGSDAFLSLAGPAPCHSSTGRACPHLPAPLPFLRARTAPVPARASQHPCHQTLWAPRPLGRFGIWTNSSQVNNLIINFFFSRRKEERWADKPSEKGLPCPKKLCYTDCACEESLSMTFVHEVPQQHHTKHHTKRRGIKGLKHFRPGSPRHLGNTKEA